MVQPIYTGLMLDRYISIGTDPKPNRTVMAGRQKWEADAAEWAEAGGGHTCVHSSSSLLPPPHARGRSRVCRRARGCTSSFLLLLFFFFLTYGSTGMHRFAARPVHTGWYRSKTGQNRHGRSRQKWAADVVEQAEAAPPSADPLLRRGGFRGTTCSSSIYQFAAGPVHTERYESKTEWYGRQT